MKERIAGLVLASALAGAFAFPRAAAACENDTDCREGRVCYDKNCVSAETAAALEKIAVERAAAAPLTPAAPSPAAPGPIYIVAPATAPALPPEPPKPPVVDDRDVVEAVLGGSVEEEHVAWKRSKTEKYPRFSDYLYETYRGRRRTGVILGGVVGPALLVGGGMISGIMFGLGSEAGGDWETFYILGSVYASVFGTTSLVLMIAGGSRAKTNGALLAKLGMVKLSVPKKADGAKPAPKPEKAAALAGPTLEFAGVAPLADLERKPRGLAFQWTF